jgi:hypothetical protein
LWRWFPAEQSRVHWDAANILDEILVRAAMSRSPYHAYQTRNPWRTAWGRIVGGILALIAIYALYFYNDGTLFSQISDALGQWLADQITEDMQR